MNILIRLASVILVLAMLKADSLSQYPTYRIYPSGNMIQIEPFIVRHPTNQQLLFASAFTLLTGTNFTSEGIYVSTNGGNSWRGNDTCTGYNINQHGGDPGPVIDKNGIFIITHQGRLPRGMFANFSTNQGLSWSVNQAISLNDQDKGFAGTDDAPASPYYGRTYLVWTKFANPFPILVSFTSNGGTNWSAPILVNHGCGGNKSLGPAVSVSPSGDVYTSWSSAIYDSPNTEDYVGFARSTNGGINWIVTECAIDCNGIRTSQLTPWTIRANSFPAMDVDKTGGPRNGWIYIAITDKNLPPAGSDPDIVIHRSTDNGNTWSPGVRVNGDPLNNGRNQFFPSLRVDEDGGVNVIYYDSRNAADSVDVYLSRSTNGGANWTDVCVSDHRFQPKSPFGEAGNMGDNMGLTSGNGKLYPVWMSDRIIPKIFQIWTTVINYSTIGINKIKENIPEKFSLMQNYPNPFNPDTKIQFDVAENMSGIKMVVYDINGREIRTLVDQKLSPGSYEAVFDASGLSSGMYFYMLIAEGFSETKKMILVK